MDENKLQDERNKEFEKYEKIYSNKSFILGTKEFKFTNYNYKFERKVLAMWSKVEQMVTFGDYTFLLNQDFQAVFDEIQANITCDSIQLSKDEKFWDIDEHKAIFINFIETTFKTIVYPMVCLKKNSFTD